MAITKDDWLYVLKCADQSLKALTRCWFLLATGILASYLFTAVPQGRAAILAAAEGYRFPITLAVLILVAVQATAFASVLLSPPNGSSGERGSGRHFAAYFVTGLVGLMPALSFSILMENRFPKKFMSAAQFNALHYQSSVLLFATVLLVMLLRNQGLLRNLLAHSQLGPRSPCAEAAPSDRPFHHRRRGPLGRRARHAPEHHCPAHRPGGDGLPHAQFLGSPGFHRGPPVRQAVDAP